MWPTPTFIIVALPFAYTRPPFGYGPGTPRGNAIALAITLVFTAVIAIYQFGRMAIFLRSMSGKTRDSSRCTDPPPRSGRMMADSDLRRLGLPLMVVDPSPRSAHYLFVMVLTIALGVGFVFLSPGDAGGKVAKVCLDAFWWIATAFLLIAVLWPPYVLVGRDGVRVRSYLAKSYFPWWEMNGPRYFKFASGSTGTLWVSHHTMLMLDTMVGSTKIAERISWYWGPLEPDQSEYYENLETIKRAIEDGLKFLRSGDVGEPKEEQTAPPGSDIGI